MEVETAVALVTALATITSFALHHLTTHRRDQLRAWHNLKPSRRRTE